MHWIDTFLHRDPRPGQALALLAALLLAPATAWAGPPYTTDDPEPVDYHHWELYLASAVGHDRDGWSGTAPHFEVNYGAAPNLQLHLIAPMTFNAPDHGGTRQYGYGDTEVGAKYRFIQEDEGGWRPMVGTFPLIEIPSGEASRGLGTGHAQFFLPLWVQKSIGKWSTYGGGGYWITPGPGNRNWWYLGWQVQRQVLDNLAIGAEIFHETAKAADGRRETRFNVGLVYDFTENHHLLFSAGRGIQGPNELTTYLAYQFTFGPAKPGAKEGPGAPGGSERKE